MTTYAQGNSSVPGLMRPGLAVPGQPGLPVPSPFAQPGRALAGRRAARRGASSGAAGSWQPWPSPFPQPRKAVPGHPAARRGGSGGSPGAPFRALPSPFPQPGRATAGKRSAVRGACSGSPGAPVAPSAVALFSAGRARQLWSAGSARLN